MSRIWVTESSNSTGWDSENILLTEAEFLDSSQSASVLGKVHRVGVDTTWNFVYGVKTGTVFAATLIQNGVLACTIYDAITRAVIASPTVTNSDDGQAANKGKFSFGFADTDTPTAGQWRFEVIDTVGGTVIPFCKGWIDILPAVPTA